MPSPTTRLLGALELLQARGRITGTELAKRLGVNRRTVRRYIVKLEEMGMPITTERGVDGSYALVAGYKLPPLMLTGDEALVVGLGLLAARSVGLATALPAVSSAQAKLERVLPVPLKKRLRAVDESVAFDFSRRPALGASVSTALATMSTASQRRSRVRMSYVARSGEPTSRELDPYGLGYLGGHWYVVGHCHLRRAVRGFRLDRVGAVESLEVSFERPAGFDVLAYLTSSIASLPRTHAIEVLLRTSMERARDQLFPAAGILESAGKNVLLKAQADELDWFARELSRLPFPFEIRKPDALRAALKAHAKRLQTLSRG